MCIRPSDVVRKALQNVLNILTCVLEVLEHLVRVGAFEKVLRKEFGGLLVPHRMIWWPKACGY